MDAAAGRTDLSVSTNEARRCRHCGTPLRYSLIDLGMSPLCESFLTKDQLGDPESYYPLHVRVCDSCWLAQLPQFVSPDHIFSEYAYFSSFSTSWVAHAGRYCAMIKSRLGLGPDSFVVELGSNDGYLLRHFLDLGGRCLGRRACRQCGGGGAEGRRSEPCRVLRLRGGEANRRRARPRRFDRRQQRPGASARSQRLRCRHGAVAGAGGRRHHRGAAPRAPHRRKPVRHDLSRALFVFLARHHQPPGCGPRAHGDRRRKAAEPRRIAARLPRPSGLAASDLDARRQRAGRRARRRSRKRVCLFRLCRPRPTHSSASFLPF